MNDAAFVDPGLKERLVEAMRRRLSPARFRHVMGVADTAAVLADRFGAVPDKAWLAGLLHDYARELPLAQAREQAAVHGLLDAVAEPSLALLHAPLGAILLREELGVSDPGVLRAVALHTTGDAVMSTLDKVVYLADYIEPGRCFPGVETVRRLAERDLDAAVLAALEQTIGELRRTGRTVDPRTLAAMKALRGRSAGEGGDA